MESITKAQISQEQIKQLVIKAFGTNTYPVNIVENKEGWFNAAYFITLSNGKEVVLKIAPPPQVKVLRYEKDILQTEVTVLQLLASSNIPVPLVYFHDYSRTIISSDYFIMEKLPGNAYSKLRDSLKPEIQEQIDIEWGQICKAINDIHGTEFGSFIQLEKRRRKWSEAFMVMIDDILQDGIDLKITLPLEYEVIRKMISSRVLILDEVKIPSLVHWDLHSGNIIVNDGKITGIIDCDRAVWGDPLIETYLGYWPNPMDIRSILKGYGPLPIDTKEGKYRRVLYDIYLYLIMVIESHYRMYSQEHQNYVYQILLYTLTELDKL